MKRLRYVLVWTAVAFNGILNAQSAFQPYNTQGDNLIHIATADFDGVGAKDYVVAMTVEGKVIAFNRPDLITDPSTDNRLWEYTALPTMGLRVVADEVYSENTGDEILLPGTDGHLRILSSAGELLLDKEISTGALYSATVATGVGGQKVIVTSGVDGLVYILNDAGVLLKSFRPETGKAAGVSGLVRHVVAGDFDGNGTDEVVAFVNRKSFEGNNFIDIIDLATYERPAYWNGDADPVADNVVSGLGFTDKQLPRVFDVDGDGSPELVAHWGVFHPEDGPRTKTFSTMLADNEKMPLSAYRTFAKNFLIQNHGFQKSDKVDLTATGKYLMQHGVPGDFDGDRQAELFTIYGDDLFLSQYDSSTKTLTISAYTWAHSMYHFSDGACLENRNGGADKMVLSGPINGDDHFYVVDFSNPNWKIQARTINGLGKLGEVDRNLDQLTDQIDQFTGTLATGDEPIWYLDYFASGLWWEMTPENSAVQAQKVYDAQQEWYDKIGGQENYRSTKIRLAASVNSCIYGMATECDKASVTAEGVKNFCAALAQKGAYFCLKIGHGPHIFITPEDLADCYEASVVDGECYMMARTRELNEHVDFESYIPHLDALLARAEQIGAEPPMVMLCAKGATFTALTQNLADSYFPKYKDILVPGVENSNVTELDISLAERVGLWMNGDVEGWGCNVIGDNLSANRVAEWGGMRNAHIVLRQMLSQYSLGAKVFRTTSITALNNPLYERGDVSDADQQWTQVFQKGILNFLKLVDKGIYPNSPDVDQIKGISPVSVGIYNRSNRLTEQSINHDHYPYQPETDNHVFNRLACWNAYTDIPETDATAYLYGTKRRWENLFPSTPGGFVTIIPSTQASDIEANSWCNAAYQTNGDTWNDMSLYEAKETISTEVLSQRNNLDFYVEGDCFWQFTQQKDDPYTYFAFLMDNNELSPVERTVKLKAGTSINGDCQVFDQVGGSEAIGTLSSTTDELRITIPAGLARFLKIELSELPTKDVGINRVEAELIKVYPNPANKLVNVEMKDFAGSKADVAIYNATGSKIQQLQLVSAHQQIPVNSWSPGVYVMHIMQGNKFQLAKLVICD
ncbi:T9SS type A sorting domain-containing protein [Carboxylicivirga mesophila]|uniref:T9SS type A sorting domain-containing protein n=1 Tax=Carboxylicivirga mesophila TaxID=1166478 RepID=A0ABS5K8L2_9BACT|nr:T9SS type A sorting domain-containing protein [Carboxylicivirga mesophila]MBS2211309.1 T9SS type A sorting domain-containing protein [Carboxylicivirga mesophila]